MASARAQQFAHERGSRTPKIYHAFENSRGRAYILDEYIEGVPATEWIKDNKGQLSRLAAEVAKELEKMTLFEVPPDATPGAVGGGVCMHGFFDDVTGAWRLYDSIEHLEKDINKLLRIFKAPSRYRKGVNFSGEKLIFCFSFIDLEKFLVGADGQVYTMDFREACFVPESFMSFTLHWESTGFALPELIAQHLPFPKAKDLETLGYASYLFHICSPPREAMEEWNAKAKPTDRHWSRDDSGILYFA
ncbi:unnamed protein product [Cyclocybe aegerita]|uniref:Aminoglycoside phosphotransferase domain-containing protein n=1 Tax=Cyclocybe aegerita TaxID=1973307 RepID=A0A8S0WEW1_CYCAE|nr:unnamed protein product [Cyclocybe aegerita]